MSYRLSRPAVGHEADPSPPYSAKVKSIWSHTSALPYIFMAGCIM